MEQSRSKQVEQEAQNKVKNDPTGRSFIIYTECITKNNLRRPIFNTSLYKFIISLCELKSHNIDALQVDVDDINTHKNFRIIENSIFDGFLNFKYDGINATYYKLHNEDEGELAFILFSDFVGDKIQFTKKFYEEAEKYEKVVNDKKILFVTNNISSGKHVWGNNKYINNRTFDYIFIDNKIRNEIIADLDRFANMESLYAEMNIKYKNTYLLYGPPGNGKSSLIVAIATYTDRSIYRLQPSSKALSDSELNELLSDLPKKCILVIEDIDSLFNNHREGTAGITFSTFINTLDGVSSNDSLITILTTNHVNKLDPSMMRSSRINKKWELSTINRDMVGRMMKKWLPVISADDIDTIVPHVTKTINDRKLSMASLQSVLLPIRCDDIKDIKTIKEKFDELIVHEMSGIIDYNMTS
jgi:hypothetical protein